MNITIPAPQEQEKPPHIEFKLVPVEDRAASQKTGKIIMRDQEFGFIYLRGGKDISKQKVPEERRSDGMPNPEYEIFMVRFGKPYEAWKKGLEIPVEGTDLKNFPLLTPAQIENCRTYHIYTVEQLAETNEEALANIGMGSRNMKMTAQRWLEFGDNGGKQVTRIEDLETQNQSLTDQLTQLTAKLEEMAAKLPDTTPAPRKPGRPKKE